MKVVNLVAVDEKGTVGLKRLKPQKKGIKVKVVGESPYTKQLILTSKSMQKIISEKDIESLLFMFPHVIGCTLRRYKHYNIEVVE